MDAVQHIFYGNMIASREIQHPSIGREFAASLLFLDDYRTFLVESSINCGDNYP
jgi:hypothetical protein